MTYGSSRTKEGEPPSNFERQHNEGIGDLVVNSELSITVFRPIQIFYINRHRKTFDLRIQTNILWT